MGLLDEQVAIVTGAGSGALGDAGVQRRRPPDRRRALALDRAAAGGAGALVDAGAAAPEKAPT